MSQRFWGIKQEVCLLSGLMLPDILTASHIVLWRECTDDKSSWRLDGANGILLSENYDRLFDRHLISFVRQGSSCVIQISERLSNSHRFQLGLTSDLYLSPNNMKNEYRERFLVTWQYIMNNFLRSNKKIYCHCFKHRQKSLKIICFLFEFRIAWRISSKKIHG